MTDQYQQDGINLQDAQPIAVDAPDATPVDVVLGALSEDGESQTFIIYGGGSNPDDVQTDNYVVSIRVTFSRDGGAVAIGASNINLDILGGVIIFSFDVDGDDCILRITGPASRYTHRLRSAPFKY